MINENKIANAQNILNNMSGIQNVKRITKDKGLIERTQTQKIILTEDNREVLFG